MPYYLLSIQDIEGRQCYIRLKSKRFYYRHQLDFIFQVFLLIRCRDGQYWGYPKKVDSATSNVLRVLKERVDLLCTLALKWCRKNSSFDKAVQTDMIYYIMVVVTEGNKFVGINKSNMIRDISKINIIMKQQDKYIN